MSLTTLTGDWIDQLRTLPDASVQCCVTSPPYWGLRDYGIAGQLGLEKTPEEYVGKLIAGFREVRRVLRDDGTLWLNLGDSYAGGGNNRGNGSPLSEKQSSNRGATGQVGQLRRGSGRADGIVTGDSPRNRDGLGRVSGLKPKDLIGIPWRCAFALQADGWYLRSEITWCKKVPMPESVQDRPTSATEKIFLLSKSQRYFYNAAAVRNPPSESWANDSRWKTGSTPTNDKNGYLEAGAQNPKQLHRMFDKQRGHSRRHAGFNDRWDQMEKGQQMANGSNMRNYWILGPEPYSEAHFATFPTVIPRKCILAGSRPGDTILDPFFGSGTTGQVALELGRKCIGIELNPKYVQLAKHRCDVTLGLPLA